MKHENMPGVIALSGKSGQEIVIEEKKTENVNVLAAGIVNDAVRGRGKEKRRRSGKGIKKETENVLETRGSEKEIRRGETEIGMRLTGEETEGDIKISTTL
ncbi:hypothetical protein K1T71_012599 [Dendrolimus kikuchii]|uniref:Uncharacterized protein n=1 Tax=Dendrolimus kikuchii TaxID=765133 RepID=A0ACC1CJR2_9NEOP|nr:hypothetical protein K1T71_012599 [Dendrolimus kikuchii]